jgi:DUF1680 family protein
MRKLVYLIIPFCCNFLFLSAQEIELKAFPLTDVKLAESAFKNAQETNLKYILELNPDRLLAPFLKEAGIKTEFKNYENWENTGLNGHIGGHYLSALSLMYASTGNAEIKNRLDYMLAELEKCQLKNGNGYIGSVPGGGKTWEEITNGKIDASGFSLNRKWVPLYNIHKTFAGLFDTWTITKNEKAREMLLKMCDWFLGVCNPLTDAQLQQMLVSEHGGINEVYANVYAQTKNQKYLDFAKRFSHLKTLDPLLKEKDELNGLHANMQIPKVIGFAEIGKGTQDKTWTNAADFFWASVTQNRSISIGGNSVREHFNPTNNFSSMVESREGPETCNSYNMLKLTKILFLNNPKSSYINYYERTLYNHILSSQHPNGGFVYFTPIRPAHYRVYSKPQDSFWCCVGSGIENHAKYAELIYAHDDENLYVNLFIPSTLNWEEEGVKLTQNTTLPFSEKSEFNIETKKSKQFKINIRYPSWVKEGALGLMVNGKIFPLIINENNYLVIDRKWKNGDKIELELPMETKAEFLPDGSDWVSFVKGPIVLAASVSEDNLTGLFANNSRMAHIASGPLVPVQDSPLIYGDKNNLTNAVKLIDKNDFSYSISDLIYQDKYKNLKLVPFYTIHNARYMLYWPYTKTENLANKVDEIKKWEEKILALDLNTVDFVKCGEQQPESDHNFKGEKTTTGIFKDLQFRNGNAWFSYDFRNKDLAAKTIKLTWYGAEKNKNFEVFANDILVTNIKLDGKNGDQFIDKNYPIPTFLLNQNPVKITVKLVATDGLGIAGIYEIRLMK